MGKSTISIVMFQLFNIPWYSHNITSPIEISAFFRVKSPFPSISHDIFPWYSHCWRPAAPRAAAPLVPWRSSALSRATRQGWSCPGCCGKSPISIGKKPVISPFYIFLPIKIGDFHLINGHHLINQLLSIIIDKRGVYRVDSCVLEEDKRHNIHIIIQGGALQL